MIAGRDVAEGGTSPTTTPRPAIAGTAAIAVEFARPLPAVELEHYEKLEGVAAHLRRQGSTGLRDHGSAANLGAAMQGLVALAACSPVSTSTILTRRRAGRIVSLPTPRAAGTSRKRATSRSARGSIFRPNRRSRSCIHK